MIAVEMTLNEYISKVKAEAEDLNFKWIIMMIGREAESSYYFDYIEKHWSSFHDLTGETIHFIFSRLNVEKNRYFPVFNSYGKAKICPYVSEIFSDSDFPASFKESYFDYDKFDWKSAHTLSISEFIKAHNISEKNLPGLYVYSVYSKKDIFIHLKNEVNLYDCLKYFTIKAKELDDKIARDIANQSATEYFSIHELEKKIQELSKGTEYENAVRMCLDNKCDYISVKERITNEQVRKKLKAIGNQRKHKLSNNESEYEMDRKKYFDLEKKILSDKEESNLLLEDFSKYVNDLSNSVKKEKIMGKDGFTVNVYGNGTFNLAQDSAIIEDNKTYNISNDNQDEMIKSINDKLDDLIKIAKESNAEIEVIAKLQEAKEDFNSRKSSGDKINGCLTAISSIVTIVNGAPSLMQKITAAMAYISTYLPK